MDPQFTSEPNGPDLEPERNTKPAANSNRQRASQAIIEDWIIWEMDPFSFRTIFISWTAEIILGYPLDDWLTQPDFWPAHLHAGDRDKVLMTLSNQVNEFYTKDQPDADLRELEYRMIAANGRSVWFKSTSRVIFDKTVHQLRLWGKMNVLTLDKSSKIPPTEKETRFQEVFRANPDGQIITELAAGQIIEANPAAYRLFGYTQPELTGHYIFSLIQPEDFSHITSASEIVKNQGIFQQEVLARPKNGPAFYVNLNAASYNTGDQRRVIWTIRDATWHRQAIEQLEQQIEKQNHKLAALMAISHSLASTLELTQLLNLVLSQFREVVNYDAAALYRVQDEELIVLAEKSYLPEMQSSEFSSFLAYSMLNNRIISRQTPFIINDLYGEMPLARALRSRLQIWAQRNKSSCHVPPCKSLLVVPLLIKGQTIGLFYLMHTAPDYYSQIQLELAQVFCDQLAVALEHQRLYQQAQQLAVLEERNRLGRELHDSTSQVLSSILLMAETGRNLLQQNATAQLPHVLDSIFSLAEGGLEEIRALIFELRPDRLAKMGLLAALSGEANALRLRYGLEVVCELGKREPELSLEMKEGLYRVAREALHNVVKHAGASRVEISLTSQKARSGAKPKICLQIRDNGQGFEMNKVPPGHFGLQTMRERVLRLGGELEIASKPGQGTLVQVTIPYD